MKKVLVTGKNGYIGKNLAKYLEKFNKQYYVEFVDLRNSNWKNMDFTKFDSIVHLTGIAHVSKNKSMSNLYYEINRDLAVEVAKKSKESQIKQFIFSSSIIVYGSNNNEGIITEFTIPNPDDFYGDSKLKAEIELKKLESEKFKVAIIRFPMVYGKGSKGNYPKLSKLVSTIPIFPVINNKRSMIYIDNLCEFIRLIIENRDRGTFYPQNDTCISTSTLVKYISEAKNKKILFIPGTNILAKLLSKLPGGIGMNFNKLYSSLYYDNMLSEYKDNYIVEKFYDSIQITESRKND